MIRQHDRAISAGKGNAEDKVGTARDHAVECNDRATVGRANAVLERTAAAVVEIDVVVEQSTIGSRPRRSGGREKKLAEITLHPHSSGCGKSLSVIDIYLRERVLAWSETGVDEDQIA